MAQVEICESLKNDILKRFKGESNIIFPLMKSLGENPRKGKFLGNIAGIAVKEIRYKSFRFYFITDGFKLKVLDEENLADLFIRFVRMSNKKEQQKTIEEIKNVLRTIGASGFE